MNDFSLLQKNEKHVIQPSIRSMHAMKTKIKNVVNILELSYLFGLVV